MNAFNKVIGYDGIKWELMRVCDILCNVDKYRELGVSTPAGILLYGDPGLGKTLMAKCFIEASGRPCFICRKDSPNGEFVNRIREIFEEAKQKAPSIIFLDDMDKFANEDSNHKNAEEYVTVQSCIDDMKGSEVFVIATVNDIYNLPDSLVRSGRFDKKIEFEAPRGEDAVKIVEYYLQQKVFVSDVDAVEVAALLEGGSCADLEAIINEAGIIAGYNGKKIIEMDDIVQAYLRIDCGASSTQNQKVDLYLWKRAYHEAGHVVAAEVLEPESVNLVSIQKFDGSRGGLTKYYQGKYNRNEPCHYENKAVVALAGKAAAEIVYGITDTGANDDIHKAFTITTQLVDNLCSYGFDKFLRNTNSNELKDRYDIVIAHEMEKYYQKAKRILIENRALLDKITESLIEKRTLMHSDIQEIIDRVNKNKGDDGRDAA